MIKVIFLFIGLLSYNETLVAQSDGSLYSFFVAGHTYGSPGVNNEGLHPPFKSKFTYIRNRQEIKFGIFTGDIVSRNPTAKDWDEVDEDIISLGLPVHFAVGNHDMEDRALFESRYGDTYYKFSYKNDLFIILDPNLDQWNISGDQLDFLKSTVESKSESVDNIFVFFHQVLWWAWWNKYEEVRLNSHEGRASQINFWTEVISIFDVLDNRVVFFSGDIGAASWSDDFMYDSVGNIEFISSGMGEGVGDNFVVVNVNSSKKIDYDIICLNDIDVECFGELKDYRITPMSNINHTWTKDFSIYPNPVESFLNIEMGDVLSNTDIEILDVYGHMLMKIQTGIRSPTIMNLTKLRKGVYFVRFSRGALEAVKMIVKY